MEPVSRNSAQPSSRGRRPSAWKDVAGKIWCRADMIQELKGRIGETVSG